MAICERFVNKGLPLIRLDEKFLYYMHVILELENHKPYHDVLAIRWVKDNTSGIIQMLEGFRKLCYNNLSSNFCCGKV